VAEPAPPPEPEPEPEPQPEPVSTVAAETGQGSVRFRDQADPLDGSKWHTGTRPRS
jgi:hypothetical protein